MAHLRHLEAKPAVEANRLVVAGLRGSGGEGQRLAWRLGTGPLKISPASPARCPGEDTAELQPARQPGTACQLAAIHRFHCWAGWRPGARLCTKIPTTPTPLPRPHAHPTPPTDLHVQNGLLHLWQLRGDQLQAALQQRGAGAHPPVRREHPQRQDVQLGALGWGGVG